MKISLLVLLLCVACARMAPSDEQLFDGIVDRDYQKMSKALSQGADANGVGYDGWTPLTLSASRQDVRAVTLLLENGAEVEALDGGGNTSLFWATYTKNYELVSVLLDAGANPCVFKGRGQSAAVIAARTGNTKLVQLYGSCDRAGHKDP